MKAFIFCVSILAFSTVLAELTPSDRSAMMKATTAVVKEKVDDFDKTTTISYAGPDIEFGLGVELKAYVFWRNEHLGLPLFMIHFIRVEKDWRWMKFGNTKVLVDDERMEIEPSKVDTDVLGGGSVYESKSLSLSLEQALRWVAAERVRVKIGLDEFVLCDREKLPLLSVLTNWIGRGGDVAAYQDLVKSILRPEVGMPYAEVIKKHGAPVWREKETGWATWERFWARFENGKVAETRTRNPGLKAVK